MIFKRKLCMYCMLLIIRIFYFLVKNLWFMKWWIKICKEIMENDNGKNLVIE